MPECTPVDQAAAVRIAKRDFAKRHPEDLKYFRVSVREDEAHSKWRVWFEGTGRWAVPGGYEVVIVDQVTGECEVVHGK